MNRKVKVARLWAISLAVVWTTAADAFVVMNNSPHRYAAAIALIQAMTDESSRMFHGVGVVTAVDGSAGSLTINHQDIKGLMQAMEMSFRVDPHSLIDMIRPGDKIEFAVEGKSYTIRNIEVIERGK